MLPNSYNNYCNNSHIDIDNNDKSKFSKCAKIQIPGLQIENKESDVFCQDDFDDISDDESSLALILDKIDDRTKCLLIDKKYYFIFNWCFKILIFGLVLSYLTWCIICSELQSKGDILLVLLISCLILNILVYYQKYLPCCNNRILPQCNGETRRHVLCRYLSKHGNTIKLSFTILLILGLASYVIFYVALPCPFNLISLSGILIFNCFCFIFSSHPKRVQWRPVLSGLIIQFMLALIILKTEFGCKMLFFLGSHWYTEYTAEKYYQFLLFQKLPSIILFSSFVSILYYLGFLKFSIAGIGWIMHIVMGTTAGESLSAGFDLFFAPLLIKPIIGRMTNSELHTVMCSGFATVSCNILAVYESLGLSTTHLFTASFMSVPAILGLSKLFYPETKRSKTTYKDIEKLDASPDRNVIEAVSSGARDGIALVFNVVANLISFLAIYVFINEALIWFAKRACLSENPTLERICFYVLRPLPLLMGVNMVDCPKVAHLLGIKMFLNNFVAYEKLGRMIRNRNFLQSLNASDVISATFPNGDMFIQYGSQNRTLVDGVISARSEMIATYSLCGFSGIATMGIAVSLLGTLAPHRRSDISRLVIRAFIVGNLASCLTGSIAGLLLTE